MSNKKILILPGDGIGNEVMAEVLKIIDWMEKTKSLSFDISERLVGGTAYDKEGNSISDDTMQVATCIVSSLIELPSLSYAVPPTNLSEISKDKDLVFSIQSIIFNTSAITSLPIPSPGKIKIFLLLIFDYTIQGWILCIFSS